jgi:hypothetical protein
MAGISWSLASCSSDRLKCTAGDSGASFLACWIWKSAPPRSCWATSALACAKYPLTAALFPPPPPPRSTSFRRLGSMAMSKARMISRGSLAEAFKLRPPVIPERLLMSSCAC